MKAKFILASAAVGSMLMFSACSNEEMPSGIATQEVRVTMSATIDQPADKLSRNELTEVDPGNINFYWTKGDAVVAVTEGGTVAGVLVAQQGGVASSELSGSLMLKDGDYNLTYYFLGNGVAVPEVGTAFDYTHSIANQSGDASEMKNHGIMATSGSVKISGGVAAAQEIMLNHLMTFAHFEMVLAESMKGSNYEVTVSGANVNNTVAVANGAITASNDETGCIKVGNNLDFYMTVAPAKQMAFTFTVKVDGDKEYTASLPAVDIAASTFLRADFEEGIPVRFEEPVPPVELDGSIFELTWAPCNNASYIDCIVSNDNAYFFTYIPEIPFAEQGLSLSYISKTVMNVEDNPYVYHFQWDRDFGFMGSDDYIEYAHVPNYLNLPSSWPSKYDYYRYSSNQCTKAANYENCDVYYYPSSSYDWCSTSGRTTWGEGQDGLNAQVEGWRLPTLKELLTLSPENAGATYTYSTTGYELEEEALTFYPFYVKQLGDGSSVAYGMSQGSNKPFVSLLRIVGNYTIDSLTAEALNDTNSVVHLPFDGYRTNTNVLKYKTRGYYWASDCDNNDGTANCMAIVLDTSARTVQYQYGSQPRKFALSLRLVKE